MSHKTEGRLYTFANLFFGISVVLAIILTICGFHFADQLSTVGGWYYSSKDMGIYSAVLLTFLALAAIIILLGFLTKCILDAFAGIHENTRRTADAVNRMAPTFGNLFHNDVQTKVPAIRSDEWRCNNCNKINKNHITTCTCGQEKGKN